VTAAITVIVVLVVVIAVFVGGSILDERRARARLLRDRLAAAQKAPEREPSEELALLREEKLSEIPALDTFLKRSSQVSALQQLLSQADMDTRAGSFLLICVVTAAVLSALVLFWAQSGMFAWAAGLIGFFLPYSYASYKRTKRFDKFEELFPQAIDTLARAVRAGHAFTTALELIANEVNEPVAGEFRKLFEEQKFGMPVRDALVNLTERVPLVDVKFFVTAVMLQRETGGNLAEITAQGRLTMMLLMGLPPLVVIVMLVFNPGFIRPLFSEPLGHTLIVIGITLQTIGYFIIRKIIQIQV
jgi:tight adherence protein B